jgi:ribosomal protein S12 methylthiotransferase accessory factor
MVFLAQPRGRSPFLPNSTGCAIHTNLTSALLRGLCEVIERDAVALTWLQRLPLKPLSAALVTSGARRAIRRNRRRFIDTRLFDATTDLGVPVAFVLELCDHDARVGQLIGAACSPAPERAAETAISECAMVRGALLGDIDVPDSAEACSSVLDGALFLGTPTRRDAFGFLLDGPPRPSARPAPLAGVDEPSWLRDILGRLQRAAMHCVAVDLTTRELRRAKLVAVKVVVPELMPISWSPRAQFRGHRRLYEAPPSMGHRAHPPDELNPWPQPFA